MAKKKTSGVNNSFNLTRSTRTLYFFIVIYALSIVLFDAGNLITRDAVIQRWTLASVLLAVNTLVWFASSQSKSKPTQNTLLIYLLTITLVVFAGFTSYWERGMASTSTIFYVLPLLVVSTVHNRHALLATTVLSSGTYAFATVKYFNDFFNEGYRIQLWGQLFLYVGTIFASAWLIMILVDLHHDSR